MATAVLHLAPHPDDELLGAPATLLGLRDAGHRVLSLACSLGAPQDHGRRRRELAAALRLAGLEGRVLEPPLAISATDDLDAARRRLAGTIRELVETEGFRLIVGPSPHDGHHGHEVVGQAARDAACELPDPPRLWFWGLWADLPMPNVFVPFGQHRMAEVVRALGAHEGELARTDYAAAFEGRARAARVLGVERTFGFGTRSDEGSPYAELLTEVRWVRGEWWLSSPRVLDFGQPLAETAPDAPVRWWLEEASVQERKRRLKAAPA